MSALLNVQTKFQDYLLDSSTDFERMIVSPDKVPAQVRLDIYRNAYRLRLIDTLASHYPIFSIYVGDEMFEKLANDYINQYPSIYRSIRWFGDQFSHFLKTHIECLDFPYLTELAKFEWLQTLVFDGPDASLLQMEEMTSIAPSAWHTMQFRLHPTFHVINLSWNVVQIWQQLSDDETPAEPLKHPHEVTWILWRNDLIHHFRSLSEDEACAIKAIANGFTFGEMCEELTQWISEEEVGFYAASLLKGWILAGLLTEVTFNGEST